ncbi:MAG TPA: HEAT repeat domain-containing protein [Deltaproteobacteria bacterium]|nr:HEAT repeat domain-containing protein [Deltaproteobacteria bacterium]
MTNPADSRTKVITPGSADGAVDAARRIITSLLLARKNFSFYPPGHSVCTKSLEQLHALLETYLSTYGDLRLDIEKDRLLLQEETVHSGPPEEGALPFTLYRDGIRWIQFSEGITVGELEEFLRIVNKYSILSDEPEGDIVTAFWETQFPNITYEVADFFWGAEQEPDLLPSIDTGEEASVSMRESKLADWAPIPDPPIDPAAIVLAPDELETLQEMVQAEEEGDPTAYLDALLDSLLQDREQDNFEIILEVLEEEFKNSLTRKDFEIALKILKSLQYIIDTCSAEIPWAIPLVEDFVLTVSSAQSLKPLEEVWQDIDAGLIEKIRQVLILLQPEAIPTLADLMLKNQSVRLRQMIIEVITALASRDMRPLESLLKSPDERLMERLVHVFTGMPGERSLEALVNLARHKSAYVRQEAVKALFQKGPARAKEVFGLIDDKEESVRRLVLKYMGQTRDRAAEDFLLGYLEHRKFSGSDSGHIMACFATLGQCGSSRSIPFLRKTLLGRGFLSVFRKSPLQEGAAVALARMRTKEAQQVLEQAGKSLSPYVRRLARKAIHERT